MSTVKERCYILLRRNLLSEWLRSTMYDCPIVGITLLQTSIYSLLRVEGIISWMFQRNFFSGHGREVSRPSREKMDMKICCFKYKLNGATTFG